MLAWLAPSKTTATEREISAITQLEHSPQGIPGTNDLVNSDEHDGVDLGKKNIILIPQPSETDPHNDPLLWDYYTKKVPQMSMVIFSTALIASLTGIAGVSAPGLETKGVSINAIDQASSFSFLAFGLVNIIAMPLCNSYGRRWAILMMTLGCGVATTIWTAYVGSSGSYYGARVIQGVLGAPVETLVEVIVADLFFEHQRATWMGVYGFALNFGVFGGSLCSAWIAQNMDWHWIYYFHAIFLGACGGAMILFLEETGFVRSLTPVKGEVLSGLKVTADSDLPQKKVDSTSSPSSLDVALSQARASENVENNEESPSVDSSYTTVFRKRSYMQRIQLFTRLRPFPTLWQFMRPLVLLFKLPTVTWAGCLVAFSLTGFQIVTGTVIVTFQEPPYNFSVGSVGLAYIGPMIGTILGSLYSGPLNDWICVKIARRRGGRHEAEDRLYVALILILIFPAAYILYGVSAYHKTHWIGPVFGLAMLGFCMVISAVVPYTYAVDCYTGIASDCIVLIVLIRNCTVSFGILWAIQPWIENQGLQNAFVAIGFIFGLLPALTCIPMIIYGKKIRKRTMHTYFNWIAEIQEGERRVEEAKLKRAG